MKIFIGFDTNQKAAYDVAKCSSEQWGLVDIFPLKQDELRTNGTYTRPMDPLSSTEFSFTRFLVPTLMNYDGWALFVDCDVLFLKSPKELFALANDNYAVMVAKHDYRPTQKTKMDGKIQHVYPRKNWSSVVLFNCAHPSNRALTQEIVNTETGQFLHQFMWLTDDEIGEIPREWNWLVDWYQEPGDGQPKLLHFTEGGPWFDKYSNCSYSDKWHIVKNTYLLKSS
jgi:lipopolysaccharide biosynthesis glycosyltransferase